MKRTYLNLNQKSKIKLVENIALSVAIIAPFTAIPQIYNIWFLHNVQGISLLTWLLFALLAIPMMFYGIICKLKPIIYLNMPWIKHAMDNRTLNCHKWNNNL